MEQEQHIVLEVLTGQEKGRRFELSRHGNFMVGRAPCAHFRLPKDDRRVSRLHFMIEFNPPLCRMLDMGSRNGTSVNGARVSSADLRHGDALRAGRTEFRVHLEPAAPAEMPAEKPAADPSLTPPAPRIITRPVPRTAQPPRGPQPVSNISLDETLQPPVRSQVTLGRPAPAEREPSPAPAPDEQIPGYELLLKLGEGGMGIVYLASRLADGRQVALKTIRPSLAGSDRELRKFVREADILKQLHHEHIVSFHEMGQGDDFAYFTMDYIDGSDAATLVARQGPFSPERTLRLAEQLLLALEYAHAAGFVHRDIKPSNVLLSGTAPSETAHLADFGLARVYHDSPLSGLTMMGDVGGTVAFMAPEQITNFREAKPAADQYAAAATLYYLLTGGKHVHDFDKRAPEKCLHKKLLEPPIPICQRRADVPAKLAAAIDRALACEPSNRFGDIRALRKALA